MLEVQGLSAGYGESAVLFDINLKIGEGEIVALMGRNGMGKTTTVHSVMGLLSPTGGSLQFRSNDLRKMPPDSIARLGLGLVPEGRHVFPTLTVCENLVATARMRSGNASPWTAERIFGLFPNLRPRARQLASTLSGGEQQMLVIGRALMTNPILLIIDEATEGLAPIIRDEIWKTIAALKEDGLSILIIDKNIGVLKRLADRHFIIEKGRTVWSGSSAELESDHNIVSRYLSV
jgi:branched-chain amino acid transport system ATP-binding protein